MALHFTREELAGRRQAAVRAMAERGLDGLLMFRQESMYYLTGYDTFGYVFFQCLYLGADGRFFLLTRAPDLRQGCAGLG
jgi:Xaa-Pro dipeptidase